MKLRPFARIIPALFVCTFIACGLTARAASAELYPADVQTVTEGAVRQIIKTYILSPEQDPQSIPQSGFTRDNWLYTLTDITETRTSGTDTRAHTEMVEIQTDSDELNTILAQLSPTLEYSADGYCGLLALDLQSVKCEAEGYKKSSYTTTATREYPHLSSNDTSLIPKSITENGRALTLDSVSWQSQYTTNVDYAELPDSYTAVAKYTASGTKSVVTGYITTATYSGEITKEVTGDTVYTAYFVGTEIKPAEPEPSAPPIVEAPPEKSPDNLPIIAIVTAAGVAALLAGASVYFVLRHNVKVYYIRNGGKVLAAKVRITAKNPVIDLTPLMGQSGDGCFCIELDRHAAKGLNNKAVEIRYSNKSLSQNIAYEGNVYTINVDFDAGIISAKP